MKFSEVKIGDTIIIRQNQSEWLVQKTEVLMRPDFSMFEHGDAELAKYNACTLTNPKMYIWISENSEVEYHDFSYCA